MSGIREVGHSKLVTWNYTSKYCLKDTVYLKILQYKSIEEISQLSWFQFFSVKVCTICVPVNISNSAIKEMIFGTQTPFPAVSNKLEGLVHPDIFAFAFKELNVDLDIRTTEFRAPVSTVVVS